MFLGLIQNFRRLLNAGLNATFATVNAAMLIGQASLSHTAFTGRVILSTFTPTALSASTNNYNTASLSVFHRISATTPLNITGWEASGGGTGRLLVLCNVGTNAITLTHLDAASTAANQWRSVTGAALVLGASGIAVALYDDTTACWRVALL